MRKPIYDPMHDDYGIRRPSKKAVRANLAFLNLGNQEKGTCEMRKIYLASSWRNDEQQNVLWALQGAGHKVYDFKNPSPSQGGFSWSFIDPNWENWTAAEYREALKSDVAQKGFALDLNAMVWADTCVLLLPCGRSAHLEMGWMIGAGKRSIILTRDGEEPELMALLADKICISIDEVLRELVK